MNMSSPVTLLTVFKINRIVAAAPTLEDGFACVRVDWKGSSTRSWDDGSSASGLRRDVL